MPGNGKSALEKTYVLRQLRFKDRQVVVLDAQGEDGVGEWNLIAQELGITPIRLDPMAALDHGIRLNPLDPSITTTGQLALLRTIIEVAMGHGLDERSGFALKVAHAYVNETVVERQPVLTETVHPPYAPQGRPQHHPSELEADPGRHPERRDMAHQLTNRALAALSTVNIRESCTPHRNDALALDSFIQEGRTLYMISGPSRTRHPGGDAPPDGPRLQRGRARPAHGRTVILRSARPTTDARPGRRRRRGPAAPTARTVGLGAGQGLPTLALLPLREQARARWPHAELPV
ncbi:hypothetical protein SFUMM280S_10084 [Streptomyces fumanus]